MAQSQVPISTSTRSTHMVTNPAWKHQAELVHGRHRRPVNQSAAGAQLMGKRANAKTVEVNAVVMWPTCLTRRKRVKLLVEERCQVAKQ